MAKPMALCPYHSPTPGNAAAVCIYYVIIWALCAPLYVHDKLHTAAADAAAPTAAPAAALAAAPEADPWIHGSISFIMSHIFYYDMKNRCLIENVAILVAIDRFDRSVDRLIEQNDLIDSIIF